MMSDDTRQAREPSTDGEARRAREAASTAESTQPRILLVDDHGLFLEGLQNLLRAGGYPVAGTARDGLEALELARELRPDIILMDIRMPRCDGLCATRMIHAELPEIKIVMLTTSAEDADLFEALKSGASGYLLKNLATSQLFDFLSGLSRGEAPLSRELSARLLTEFTHQAAALDERGPAAHADASKTANIAATELDLTARQREVLELVADGLSYKEIGTKLALSENTVKYHMGEILQRLHLKNRAQATAYALRAGLARE